MTTIIFNAADRPIGQPSGTLPNVGGAMLDWFQPMQFETVTKSTVGFQVVEAGTVIEFQGVIQPFQARDLQIKPEGQRAWSWYWLHAEPGLTLQVDEVVTYLGVQTRVMSRKDYSDYGYVEYSLVQDWTGSGPTT